MAKKLAKCAVEPIIKRAVFLFLITKIAGNSNKFPQKGNTMLHFFFFFSFLFIPLKQWQRQLSSTPQKSFYLGNFFIEAPPRYFFKKSLVWWKNEASSSFFSFCDGLLLLHTSLLQVLTIQRCCQRGKTSTQNDKKVKKNLIKGRWFLKK